jgi:hypothetical protein
VIVQISYEAAIISNDPEIPLLEAIRGARVVCPDLANLMLAAALYDDFEVRRHLDQRRTVNLLLCAAARHFRSAAWIQAAKALLR